MPHTQSVLELSICFRPAPAEESKHSRSVYGSGFLTRIKRSTGDVLAYRWHDDGRERKRILGPVRKLKSEAAAWKEVERLRLRRRGSPETVEQLAQHWKEKESSRRAFSTSETISGYLAN